MITFHPVTLADRALFERYILPGECRNCDLSFANIFCWQEFHHTMWAEVEGFLVIRFYPYGRQDAKSPVAYMQPVGEGDFAPILPLLAEDAAATFGQGLRLYGLCREGRRVISAAQGVHFAYDDDRSLSDYIYLAEDLRTLTGRRYQPKRNHLNRFQAAYNYRYEPLTPACFDECLALEEEWRAQRQSPTDSASMRHERRALELAFRHWEELDLRGGVIRVDDRLAAFTYGSAITYDTFDCHVEKADTRYEGIFTAINRLFVEQLPATFTYLNREEDMGLEGLRRSKLSYYPVLLWPKTTARLLTPREEACKRLWMEVFGDEEAFVDRYFVRHYQPRYTLTRSQGEELQAMLHLIPFDTEWGRTAYLYAIATDEHHRHRGLASELIREAIALARSEGFDVVALIPSSEELRGFYGRLGFSGCHPMRFVKGDFDFGTGSEELDQAMLLPL